MAPYGGQQRFFLTFRTVQKLEISVLPLMWGGQGAAASPFTPQRRYPFQ